MTPGGEQKNDLNGTRHFLEKWSHRAIASIRTVAIFVMFFNESAFGVLSASRNLRPLQLFR